MRILVPIIALLLGLLVAFAFLNKSSENRVEEQQREQVIAQNVEAEDQAAVKEQQAADKAVEEKADTTAAVAPVKTIEGLHVLAADNAQNVSLGTEDPEGEYDLKVNFVKWGSGIKNFTLARYDKETGPSEERYTVEGTLTTPAELGGFTAYPYAASKVLINGQSVNLLNVPWNASEVRKTEQGEEVTMSVVIADAGNKPVLEIQRTFLLPKKSYSVQLQQKLVNKTGEPIDVQFIQYAQGDVIDDGAAYLGDRRLFLTAYFPESDTTRSRILLDSGFVNRRNLLSEFKSAAEDNAPAPSGLWPNDSIDAGSDLAWFASENRYFSVVTSADVPSTVTTTRKVEALQSVFPVIRTEVVPSYASYPNATDAQRFIIFSLESQKTQIAAGDSESLDISIFAGPRYSKIFKTQPYIAMNFDEMVRYELGCTWCTFQPLARGLLWFLTVLHAIFQDWGIAIVILVLFVRLLLHPITRRSQINMMKMGKQMQALQPEMEKLKKKYADDAQALQRETMKLYREKGVNPLNMLGCLPMLLQMPIWVALYAMLYYAIELRGQPAFYNLFHQIGLLFNGHEWAFLTDLSSPDRFITLFDEPKTLSLFLTLDYSSINLLPLLMAVVFFFQQKFTTPPATTDQAKQQQKMMKFMVFLFPLFLYSAPSGLTLYILASTSAGIIDSYIVRKHVKELEESGELFKPRKPRKAGGFGERMQKMLEAKMREQQQKQQGQNRKKK